MKENVIFTHHFHNLQDFSLITVRIPFLLDHRLDNLLQQLKKIINKLRNFYRTILDNIRIEQIILAYTQKAF